jgi:fluoride ion exporter CrcB/FEX
MKNDLTLLDVLLGVLLVLFIGAYFGASYADTNWRHNMNTFSETHQKFKFDEGGKFYTISSFTVDMYKLMNASEIQNISIP